MSRKVNRVEYRLDSRGIHDLPFEEIRVILRAADELIGQGGRSLLVKILKGSRAKDIIGKALDRCPVHGYYREHSAQDVLARIDWLIHRHYLEIRYEYRLPLLVYGEKGWEIEKETYSDELLDVLREMAKAPARADMSFLKDRNHALIVRLLEKIEATGDAAFVPLLEAWAQIDAKNQKKVRQCLARCSTA